MNAADLATLPLFGGMSGEQLGQIATSCEELEIEEGTVLLREGDFGHAVFAIRSGTADIVHDGAVINTLGPGDYFGEIALIDEGARTATVTAETDMTTYAMTFWEFRPIVETDARIAWKLVQALAHRLREADAR
jgi:CRP-like cAMP-binding protein